MLRPVLFITLLSLLFPFITYSQQLKNDNRFAAVDSLAKTIRYRSDIYKLTNELTGPYTEQALKVRAIFIWITDNIKYDYKFVNKGKEIKGPECKTGMDCEQVRVEWEKAYLGKVLSSKKAICDGYARLLKKMCGIAGIRCDIISGYTRNKPYQIGNPGSVNHAWNAVWVDSTYQLLDPTWAAGFCAEDEETEKLLSLTKRYNDYYWFTSFNDLTRNHYPKDGKWVFEPGYTKDKYAANPYYAPEIISKIKLLSPASGIINAVKGDTLHFKFDYKGDIKYLQVNSNLFRNPAIWDWEKKSRHHKVPKPDTVALRRQQYTTFKRSGDTCEFDYVVPDNSLYYLELLFDYRKVMRFNLAPPSQGH